MVAHNVWVLVNSDMGQDWAEENRDRGKGHRTLEGQ